MAVRKKTAWMIQVELQTSITLRGERLPARVLAANGRYEPVNVMIPWKDYLQLKQQGLVRLGGRALNYELQSSEPETNWDTSESYHLPLFERLMQAG